MATIHQQYTEFNGSIKLTSTRKESLKTSRKDLKKKIKKWFKENKEDELQPKFWGQGSFEMNTTINPISVTDNEGNILLKFDLDYGIYFIENDGENNKQTIETWHDWVYSSVENHANQPPTKKASCIRVIFSDGHHIDLPIYYKKGDLIELAHREQRWTESDPKEFFEWFNNQKTSQLERIVRYLKAWKNFKENQNSNLKLPAGFELTILATNNYINDNNDDEAFRKTVIKIKDELKSFGGVKCLRPTTPKDEDLFINYSETRKNDFLTNLDDLVSACNNSKNENNRKKASELMQKQFGGRFPLAADIDEEQKSAALVSALSNTIIRPKPFVRNDVK